MAMLVYTTYFFTKLPADKYLHDYRITDSEYTMVATMIDRIAAPF